MRYEVVHSHYTRSCLPNRNIARRWRASQRALKLPLTFLDPALRALYVSAMELQAKSSNIVACNPYTKEAEELAYPLHNGQRNTWPAVAVAALAGYARVRRLGWCCWCSFATERPSFATFTQDPIGSFLECFECGFFVPLNKIYETATELAGYPYTANGALQPIIKSIAIPPPKSPSTRPAFSRRTIRQESSTPYSLRPRIKVEKEESPELPSMLEEIFADIKINENKNGKKKKTSRRQRHSAPSTTARTHDQAMELYTEPSDHDQEGTKIEFCPYCGNGFVEDFMDSHLREECTEYTNDMD